VSGGRWAPEEPAGSRNTALKTIAWIDAPSPRGTWGHPNDLAIPLADRGLLLGDGLFETILIEGGRPRLLGLHLKRWQASAALLGMAPPPGMELVERLIEEAMVRSGLGHARSGLDEALSGLGKARGSDGVERCGALRLNWSRGIPTTRGIDLSLAPEPPPAHRFWLQLSPCQPAFTPVTTIHSRHERRNAHSRLSRCKTFAYGPSIQARREARAAGADDALLLSTTGELCCGTTANLLLKRGDRWLTPPLSSGCLPGVMRGRALELGLAVEAHLGLDDLDASDAAVLINSLGCRPVVRCDQTNLVTTERVVPALAGPTPAGLTPAGPTLAEQLWRLIQEQQDIGPHPQ